MLTIHHQETVTAHGNECFIENCYTLLECHGMYIVMNVRRFKGWCDNGIEIVDRRDFTNYFDAIDYYNQLKRSAYENR